MARALSPMYLSTIAEATTLRNLASIWLARVRAKSVLPVPGGPYNNTPLGGFIPRRANSSGLVNGSSIVSLKSLIWEVRPPTSPYPTFPGSSAYMLCTLWSTSRGNIPIIVYVLISIVIRVPGFSRARSIFGRQPTTSLEPPEVLTKIRSSVIF